MTKYLRYIGETPGDYILRSPISFNELFLHGHIIVEAVGGIYEDVSYKSNAENDQNIVFCFEI